MEQTTVLYAPAHELLRTESLHPEGVTVLIDPLRPNWVGTDDRGAAILSLFDGRRTFGAAVSLYATQSGLPLTQAWQHVDTIARDALRQQFLSDRPLSAAPYAGRAAHLTPPVLSELWIHTNNSCNLACRHCLVSSGPDEDRGLRTEVLLDLIAQARALGTHRFFFTGGEPFLRKDIFKLIDVALCDPKAQLAILTNGLLFSPARLEALMRYEPDRLQIQISLDGSTPEINDPIRGAGSFTKIADGIRTAIAAGLSVTVSTVIADTNVRDVPDVTRRVAAWGGTTHHLLWLHKRGRADDSGRDRTPSVAQVIDAVRKARAVGREVGVTIDNDEAIKVRLRYPIGTRRDLSGAGLSILCVYSDGAVYPSAAMADTPALHLGNILSQPLAEIWQKSAEAQLPLTVSQKPICQSCPIRFFCGGGDMEHAYFYGGSPMAHDPYCELHKAMFADAFHDLTLARRDLVTRQRSGFNVPVLYTGMGEQAVTCATEETPKPVMTSRSECVLTFDLDAPRKVVRAFYGAAAETPSAELCCPITPNAQDLAHIPAAVIERFYGCGSPVGMAQIRAGETTLDLGSGAGIDVFIAAKRVGPAGRAIGVDMTAQMLSVAREAQREVAQNLGYDVVTFLEGFLEAIPLPDRSVDLVTSNCVINLSPDKKQVFSEMWRVLADHGRIVVADIVADRAVPPHQRKDPRLWGECISGALTEEAFLAELERAGFYGLEILKRMFWKEVEGVGFWSVTVRGYKFEKRDGCTYVGQTATYLGPFKGVSDEEGHWFPRNVAVAVCTDTAAKLAHPPYAGLFLLVGQEVASSGETGGGCDPETGCC